MFLVNSIRQRNVLKTLAPQIAAKKLSEKLIISIIGTGAPKTNEKNVKNYFIIKLALEKPTPLNYNIECRLLSGVLS